MAPASFQPLPAVDIRGGRCVQLVRGDFDQQRVYGDDPVEMARRWVDDGARWLHVVDLDGAREGARPNAAVVRRLLAAVSIPVQVGGGVRSLEAAQALVADGAARVIVGTLAVEQFGELRHWVEVLGSERLVVGVDARDGRVATRGWAHLTEVEVETFCQALAREGVRRILLTDIARDGMLQGPNVALVRTIAAHRSLAVLASGGVTRLEDLRQLAEAGAEGAIVGTALYERRFRLAEALAAVAVTEDDAAC